VQLGMLLLMVSYLFGNIGRIDTLGILAYGLFIFLFVYALTDTMDGNRYAWVWELLKSAVGIAIIFLTGDWFGADRFSFLISYILLNYFVIAVFTSAWLLQNNKRQAQQQDTQTSMAA
jgi:hypothetical protein